MKRHAASHITLLGREIGIWQGLFYLHILIYGLVILLTFTEYGITSDESAHVEYGEAILQWYGSLFQDRTVFESKNTWLHGGFFNTVSHLIGRLSPLGIYETRHLCNALLGLLGVVAAYRLGCLLGGSATGCLAALFLVLTPRYYGHAFNNPKDIPFAVFYLWSVYFIVRGVGLLPRLPVSWIWKTGLSIGLALGTRAGGLVLIGYLGLFYGVRYVQLAMQQWGRNGRAGIMTFARPFALQMVSILGLSYGTMLVFWPFAQIHPLSGLFDALRTFSRFPEVHYSLFEGSYIESIRIPWYYLPKWLLLTLPEFLFVGVLAGAAALCRTGFQERERLLQRVLLAFCIVFPVGYALLTQPALYDACRHFLFVVPPLAVLSAVGIGDALTRLRQRWSRRGLIVLAGGLLTLTFWEMVRLHPNEYVYFNRLFAGGLQTASAHYETDYWEHSYKQGIRWIEANATPPPSGRRRSVSSVYSNIRYMLNLNRYVYVEQPETADFYLGTTRYDRHRVVPGEVMHTVRAAGVPLLYIIRPDSSYGSDPFFSESPFRHAYLGRKYGEMKATGAAIAAYERALELTPETDRKSKRIALIHVRLGNLYSEDDRIVKALKHYRTAIDLNPQDAIVNAVVYNNVGLIYADLKDYGAALNWIKKAIVTAPGYVRAYENLGDLYRDLKRETEAIDAYRKLGTISMHRQQYDRAVVAYLKAVALNPKMADLYSDLGTAYMKLKRYTEAEEALDRALAIDPAHTAARKHRAEMPSGRR